MSNLHIKSPAKVNLHLKILKKLHDGYHELDTSFQLIDLYDEISFKKINKGISVNCNIKISIKVKILSIRSLLIFKKVEIALE